MAAPSTKSNHLCRTIPSQKKWTTIPLFTKVAMLAGLLAIFGCNDNPADNNSDDTQQDLCAGVVCNNGGTCVDGNCLCPNGFTGQNCEQAVDPCNGVTCLNGGTCVGGNCVCPQGYSGTNCETAINPCQGVTCQNGGTCSNGTCTCPAGYTGTRCETQRTPVSIIVSRIVLHSFPVLKSDGSNWDAFGGKPDLKIEIKKGTQTLYTSDVKQDVTEGTTQTYTTGLPISLTGVTQSFTITLWDQDVSAHDQMGTKTFTPYSSTNGFPSRLRYGSFTTFDVELYVTYQF